MKMLANLELVGRELDLNDVKVAIENYVFYPNTEETKEYDKAFPPIVMRKSSGEYVVYYKKAKK